MIAPGQSAPTDGPEWPVLVDVEQIAEALQNGTTSAAAATEVLLRLSSREPHPRVRAALLQATASLVAHGDASRATGLYRESFRLFPTVEAGQALAQLTADDPTFQRLFRYGHLVDAVAALAAEGPSAVEALADAARGHITQGHGRAALLCLDRLLAARPDHAEAQELRETALAQVEARQEALTAQRLALAECDEADRANSLLAYAELLLAGDEPLDDAAAVLADAVDSGADLAAAAPLWVEVARALGDQAELARALACSLAAGDVLPTRLQHADELVNIAGIDRTAPAAALIALQVLHEALPDDLGIAARLDGATCLASDDPDGRLEAMRLQAVRDRDRLAETVASLGLASLAVGRQDWANAERHYRRVRTLAPQDGEALDFFERYYRQIGDHKRLLVALSQRLGATEGRETVRIALEMAQLCEGPLESPDRAVEAYQRVLTVQPDHDGALRALQALHERHGRWPAVRDTLERTARAQLAKAAVDPRTKNAAVSTLEQLVAVCADPARANDKVAAAQHARQILDLDPDHADALALVDAHLQQTGRFTELVALLRRAAAQGGNAKAALLLRMGNVLADDLGQPAAAIDAWRSALDAQPGLVEAQARLRRAARATGDSGAVLASLLDEIGSVVGSAAIDLGTPVPTALGAPVSALQAAPGLPESAGQPTAVAQAPAPAQANLAAQLLEAAVLAEARIDGKRLAGRLFALILAASPDHDGAVAGLMRCWSTAEDGAQLQSVLGRLASLEASPVRKGRLLTGLAETQLNVGMDMPGALATAKQARQLVPDDPQAREIHIEAAIGVGDLDELRAACGTDRDGLRMFVERALDIAAQTSDVQRFSWWRVAATVLHDQLGETERAALALSDAVAACLSAAAEPAKASTQQLLGPAERGQLCDQLRSYAHEAGLRGAERLALEAWLEVAEGAELRSARLALVDLMVASGELGDADAMARSLAEEAVGERDAAMLVQALDRQIGLVQDPEVADPALGWESIADVLALATGDTELLATASEALLERCVHACGDLAQGETLWPTLARIAEAGLACCRPQDAATRLQLLDWQETACVESGQWQGAVGAAQALAEANLGDGASGAASAAWVRAAEWALDRLSDASTAEALYRKAVNATPEDTTAWAGLVSTLRSGDATALALVLDEVLALPATGRESRARYALERAELSSTLGESDPLGAVWPVITGLGEVDDLTEAEEALVAIAAGQLDVPELGSSIAQRLLSVFERHGRGDEAMRCRELIALHAPRRSDARISGLVAVADAVAEGSPRQAFDALFHAVADAPDRTDLFDRLDVLAGRIGAQDRLQRLLRGMAGLDASGEFVAVAEPARARVLAKLAELAAARADHAQVVEACLIWRTLQPDAVEPWAIAERAHLALGDHQAADEAAAAQTERGSDVQRADAWLRRIARAGDGDPAATWQLCKQAVGAIAGNVEIRQRHIATARALGDDIALAEALAGAVDALPAALTDAAAARRELAEVLTRCGSDRALDAVARWLALLDDDPADDDAIAACFSLLPGLRTADPAAARALLERLEPIADARGESDRVDALLGAMVDLAADDAARMDLLQRQARVREVALGDPLAALACLGRAVGLSADVQVHLAGMTAAGKAAQDAGQPAAEVAAVFESAAVQRAQVVERLALRRAGLRALGNGAGLDAARALLEGVLGDDPADADAMAQLDRLAAESGDAKARLALLTLRIARASDANEASAIWLERAQVAAEAGLADDARQSYAQAAQSDDVDLRITARASLAELCENAGDLVGAARAVCGLVADHADRDDRIGLYMRAAALAQAGDDLTLARAILTEGLAEAPQSVALFNAMDAVLVDAGDDEALVAHLHGAWRRVDGLGEDDRHTLAARWIGLVQLQHGPGDGLAHAAATLHVANLAEGAVDDALDALTAADTDSADWAPWQQHAWLLVADRAARANDVERELGARLQLGTAGLERATRIDGRRRAAALLDQIGETGAALAKWYEVLELGVVDGVGWSDPDVDAILDLADRADASREAGEYVQLAAAELTDRMRKAAVLLRLANRAAAANDREAQWAFAQQVLADDPAHPAALAVRGEALAAWPDAPVEARIAHARDVVASADKGGRPTAQLVLAGLLIADPSAVEQGVQTALSVVQADAAHAEAAFALVEPVADKSAAAVELARLAAPRSAAAAAWLQNRARQAGDWAELDALLAASAERAATDDPEAAVAALLELADLRAGERNDGAAAAKALDRARQIAPTNEAVLRLRLQIADDAGDHAVVADLCDALAGVVQGDEMPVLSFRAAEAWRAAADLDRATAACDRALAADDTAADAHLLRAELLDLNGQSSLAVSALDAAAGRTRTTDQAAAARLWLRAAELARKAELTEAWSKALAQACAAGAGARAAALAPAQDLEGAWLKRAVADLAPALHAAGLPAEALALRRRLADSATGPDRLAARRGLAQQSAADGDAVGALATLFDVATDRELPPAELLDVLVEAYGVAVGGQLLEDWIDRVAELVACGDVPEDQATAVVAFAAQAAGDAGHADRGADLWDALWDQRPDDGDARDGTLALRRLADDPARLAAALEKALVFADAADKPTLRSELATLKLDGLGRPREALRLVQDVLGADPAHADALKLAERLTDNAVLGDEALTLLDKHYRTTQNWPGLERVLQKRMDRAKNAASKAEIAQMLAHLQAEQLSHADDALRSLWAAMQADPRLTTLEAIEKLAGAADHDEMLAKAYAQVLTTPLRPDDRAQVLTRAAALDKRRGDLAAAERRLREALQAAPNLGEAFDLLDTLLDEQNRFGDLVSLLLDRASKVGEPDVQRALIGRAAELARATNDQEAALEAYARLAALDPADVGSRLAQVEILRDAGLGARLAEALAGLAQVTDDRRERADLLCEAARLQMAGTDAEERISTLYRQAFDACPACDEAFVWLERHLHGNPRQLVPMMQARADALPKGPTRTLALRKLAHAHRDLDDAAGACAALEAALADDAHNAAVLDELIKTAESLRNWTSWANAMELRLVNEKAREVRVAHLAQLARVLLTELDDQVRARPVVAELQKLAPKEPATRQVLAMVKSHSGDPAEAAAGLEQVVRETDEPQALLAIHQQLADLYLGPLNNPGKGIRELQRLVALDPRRWEFRRKLCDLYAERQSYEALAESLKQWLAQLEDPDDKRTLQLARGMEIVGIMRELAQVLMTLGKPQEAATNLRRAWELNGNDPDLNASLAPLLELTGEARLAGELHDWLATHHASDKAKVALHLSRSALLHERQGDLQGARDRFKKAMESAPGDDDATLGSARVCLALGEADRAMRLFDLVARKPANSVPADLRADAQVGMGKCRLQRNQRDQARACFEQALALVPGHKAAAEALQGL